MGQVILNNGDTGLVCRNAINGNFEQLFLLNTVNVNSPSDFPTPSGGLITLADNTRYVLGSNSIDIGSDEFQWGANTLIEGGNLFAVNLISSTNGTMFHGEGVGGTIRNVRLNCTGSYFDFTNIAQNTTIFVIDNTTLVNGVNFGTFDDLSVLQITNTSAAVLSGTGLQLAGGDWVIVDLDKFSIFGTSPSFKGIDLGSATFSTLELRDTISLPLDASGFGISGLANNGNMVNGNIATIQGSTLGSVGAALENITKKDVKFRFINNVGVADSKVLGAMQQSGNILETTLVDATPVQLAGTFSSNTSIERAEVVSNQLKMLVDGSGVAFISLDGAKSGGGSTATVEFCLFKNNSAVPGVIREVKIGSDPATVSLNVPVEYVANDLFDIRITRTNGSSNWVTANATLLIE